jgi:hypothetical protein
MQHCAAPQAHKCSTVQFPSLSNCLDQTLRNERTEIGWRREKSEREAGRLLIFRTERECVCVCGATDGRTDRHTERHALGSGLNWTASQWDIRLSFTKLHGRSQTATVFNWAVIKAKWDTSLPSWVTDRVVWGAYSLLALENGRL